MPMLSSPLRCEYRHGTSPEAIGDLPDGCAAAVVTDPPYGTQPLAGGYGRRQLYGGTGRTITGDGDLGALERTLPALWRLLGPDAWMLLWCGGRTRAQVDALCVAVGFEPFGEIAWDKGNPGLGYTIRYSHESLVFYTKGEPKRYGAPVLSVQRQTASIRTKSRSA